MNSIDSQIPQMPEVRIARLEEELEEAKVEWDKADKLARKRGELLGEAREENARLRAEVEALTLQRSGADDAILAAEAKLEK